jgi:hypothetical protein
MNIQLLKNKNLYKLTAAFVKYAPIVLALLQMIMTILNYAGISAFMLSFIGGSSLMFLGLLYLLSYLFQYCYLYRIPIGYCLIINVLVMLRTGNLLTNIELLDFYRILMIVAGIFISIFVYFMYKNRKNPKVGGIKSFCEKYCD